MILHDMKHYAPDVREGPETASGVKHPSSMSSPNKWPEEYKEFLAHEAKLEAAKKKREEAAAM